MITLPMEDILDWATELVADFMPLIVVVLGIAIGFWVIDRIIHRKD